MANYNDVIRSLNRFLSGEGSIAGDVVISDAQQLRDEGDLTPSQKVALDDRITKAKAKVLQDEAKFKSAVA